MTDQPIPHRFGGISPAEALGLLREHAFLTVGCTDPIAIALAAAHAARAGQGNPLSIRVRLDKNVYKDALEVGIPGTSSRGLPLAAALGALKGDPKKGLALLEDVTPEQVLQAEAFLARSSVTLELDPRAEGIFVHATVLTDRGEGEAVLKGGHDRLEEVRRNGELLFCRAEGEEEGAPRRCPLALLEDASMGDLKELAEALPPEATRFLLEGVSLNRRAAEVGLRRGSGLGLGKRLESLAAKGFLEDDDLRGRIRRLTAGAADARMGGEQVPIFGCFGSGNHGITLFLTLGLAAEAWGSSPDDLARALALGLLVVGSIKAQTGILTPHCGCAVAAGCGAAAGLVLLRRGTAKQAERAVLLLFADLAGMLCDGAKYGCALKISTSAGVALESALLALEGAALPPGNGLVGKDFRETLRNLREVTEKGMKDLDRSLLEILLRRETSPCP